MSDDTATPEERIEAMRERVKQRLDFESKEVGWLLSTLEAKVDAAILKHRCSEGVLSMTVHRLEGTVEGNPTGRHNFLQRIDELRRIETAKEAAEAENARLRAELLTKVQEWRYQSNHGPHFKGTTYQQCADELSALLAPPAETDHE